ncbi:MAG: hypothetical protein AAGL29_06095 [Bacteroidota bacterium]
MRKPITLILLLLVFFSCDTDDGDPTATIAPTNSEIKKGIFGLRDGAVLSDLGAEYTRIITWDSDIKAIYADVDNGVPLENNLYYNQIKGIYDNGVKIIVTLRWPDQNSADPALYDRVPQAQDRIESLDLLSRFLNDFGPLLEIYSVQNEVGGLGPGTYTEENMVNAGSGSPAALWWQDIVQRVAFEKESNPNLMHLKIGSPVPVLLKRLVFDSSGLPQTNIDFFYETVAFGNEYCDYVDLHLNTFSLSEYEETLFFLNGLVTQPMMATEWSEVSSANAYIAQPISRELASFAEDINYTIPGTVTTNDELVEYLYNNPSTMDFWQFMVQESNYEEGFMEQSSALLSSAGFEILCWNSGWQEGLTAYDLRSFYATKTVSSANNELSSFTNEFKNL